MARVTGTASSLSWLVVLCALLASSACYSTLPDGRPAQLQIEAKPKGASVYIDDRYIASAQVLAERPHTLEPGKHQVTLKAPGHFPHDFTVDLEPGVTTVTIQLRPIPP
jgi:hypothetical protein